MVEVDVLFDLMYRQTLEKTLFVIMNSFKHHNRGSKEMESCYLCIFMYFELLLDVVKIILVNMYSMCRFRYSLWFC